MTKPVVIVETAAKAESLAAQLGEEVEILLVRSLPAQATPLPPAGKLRRELPRFSFAPLPREKEFFERLAACQGRELYLGFDADGRGEYWSWLISGCWAAMTGGLGQLRRLVPAGVSGPLLRDSFRRVEPVAEERGTATQVRMLFDAALGRHLQRLLGSRSGPGGVLLNFLSLTTIFLLAERETEIRLYTPLPRWRVRVKAATGAGELFLDLEEAYGVTDDGVLRNEKEVQAAISLFSSEKFQLGEGRAAPFSLPAPVPHRLVDLLHDCLTQAGFSPLAAMAAIRNLSHGVEIDGRRQGLLTSCLPIGQGALAPLLPKIREEVARRWGAERLGEPSAEELAGAILPLFPELGPEALAAKLPDAELAVYRLVWGRALASQMRPAQGEVIEATVSAGEDCLFSGSARGLVDPGFLALYQGGNDAALLAPSSLKGVGQGTELQCLQVVPEKNIGLPPEYFTMEGLAGELAEYGFDLDGLMVAQLQQLLDCGYLRLLPDGTFRCAENAAKVITVMNRALPSMKGINFSAYLAQTVAEAVSGRKPLVMALQQFEQTLLMRGEVLVKLAVPVSVQKRGISSRSIIRGAGESPTRGAASPEAPLLAPAAQPVSGGAEAEALPASGAEPSLPTEPVLPEERGVGEEEALAPVAPTGEEARGEPEGEKLPELKESAPEAEAETEVQASGAAEAAASAELFAQAPATLVEAEPLAEAAGAPEPCREEADPREAARPCPDCGKPLLLREDRFGKYWSCSGHPECRHSESYASEGVAELACPLCGTGKVVAKQTPAGKRFYVCPEADCEFMAWARPHPIPCPLCASPFLVEKKSLAGKPILRCPRAGCSYLQPLTGGEGGAAVTAAAEPGSPVRKKVLVRRVGKAAPGGATRKVRIVRKK